MVTAGDLMQTPVEIRPAPPWTFSAPEIFARSLFGAFAVLKHAAFVRNLQVAGVSPAFYVVSDGGREVRFWEHTPETTTFVARRLSISKSLTKTMLQQAGIRVPTGKEFSRTNRTAAWRFARSLGLPVVVKPTAGEGGAGVTPGVTTEEHFELAWNSAVRASRAARIIVERHVPGTDFRLYVVGERLVAAAQRIPAYVEGDGRSSIAALVSRKNEARRSNPFLGRKTMKLTPAMVRNLRQIGLTPDSILEGGRRVTLHTIANIGAGGESVDVTERVHPDFHRVAVRSCKAIPGAINTGVDLLVEDPSAPASGQEWAVCEVNTCPGIAMHHFPAWGTPRDAAGALIEHLFPGSRRCEPSDQRGVRAVISGNVRGVGFRRWIWRRAHLRGLTGSISNRHNGSVEALFRGAPRAVDDMLSLCRSGPPKAAVGDLAVEPWTGTTDDDFVIQD